MNTEAMKVSVGLVDTKVGEKLTSTARPADLYSNRRGTICSASTRVDTMMLAGPVPSPTWSLVSSVV